MVLYADILFLVDLSMDFLTLYLCARLTHRPTRWYRTLSAAVLGALGSVLLTVFSAGRGVTFGMGLFLSVLMTAVNFGFLKTVRAFGRQCLLVWGCGAVTGGCVSMLLSLGEPVYLETGQGGQPHFLPLFLTTVGTVYALVRCLQKRMHAPDAMLTVEWQQQKAEVQVLVDSGNLLTDPLTGRAVILLSADAVPSLTLPDGAQTDLPLHTYPVPARGLHGTRLLWAVRPTKLLVNGKPQDALIAAERVPADHYGGYGGTCPLCLL